MVLLFPAFSCSFWREQGSWNLYADKKQKSCSQLSRAELRIAAIAEQGSLSRGLGRISGPLQLHVFRSQIVLS